MGERERETERTATGFLLWSWFWEACTHGGAAACIEIVSLCVSRECKLDVGSGYYELAKVCPIIHVVVD